MRHLFGLLIFCFTYMGCSSSYMVSASPSAERSFSTFNAEAKDRNATIFFHDGIMLSAQNVFAAADSTFFMNVKTGAISVVPTREIKKIVFSSWSVGIGDGALYGLLGGAAAGLLLAAITYPFLPPGGGDFPKEANFLAMPAIGGGAGLIIGPIVGGIRGHTYEYTFVRESK